MRRAESASGNAHKLDLYTAMDHVDRRLRPCHSLGLSDGFTMADFRHHETNKVAREHHFPPSLLEAALQLTLSNAQASCEADKRLILEELSRGQPVDNPYAAAERAIRGRVAIASLRRVVDLAHGPLVSASLGAMRACGLSRVGLNFSSCRAFTVDNAKALARAL